MTVLVTGGAGYIGSHMVKMLRAGHRDAVPAGVEFVEADTADTPRLAELLRQKGIAAVIHFAAFSQVGESTAVGNDWDTRDGTCVRDYVHVVDLCDAHLRALDWLEGGGGREAINLGSEHRATVLLVASCERARRVLGWTAQRPDIATIVRHAWAFEQRWA